VAVDLETAVVREAARHKSRAAFSMKGPAMAENDTIQVKSAANARGAERGPTVRNVLVSSLGSAIVALAIIFLTFFHT
jgi:hypothetical protein